MRRNKPEADPPSRPAVPHLRQARLPDPARDTAIVRLLAPWFRTNARPLPWRRRGESARRDPYRSLVSEFMLQQTQVSRVLDKFDLFLARFPTLDALASAPEGDVLAVWSGLGYYRRARNLHAAAKAVAERFGGIVPRAVDDLLSLPGIGRYTAGAIASIVYGRPEPIVDGNVARVLMRLDGRDGAPDTPETVAWTWDRAHRLAAASVGRGGPGLFNEALMEHGATICTPRAPRCMFCPVRAHCHAFAQGRQDLIPRPKRRAPQKELHSASVIIEDSRSQVLIERRPDRGLWAGLWQAPTLERDGPAGAPTADDLAEWIGLPGLQRCDEFTHGATHRVVRFTAWRVPTRVAGKRIKVLAAARRDSLWMARERIATLALSNPQRRILLGEA